jgi:site-specific DNA recombinase
MTSGAIYARVSSRRQAKDHTIGSQLAALREHAAGSRLEVPEEWVFCDEGHSGATLVRPGLEALRDLAAQGCLDVVLCYSPDRLARKFAYQALLIEEFARAGVRVEFVNNGARGDTPEDQLLVQFQGMFAEYERYAELGIVLVMPTARLCRLGGETPARTALAGRLSRHNHRPSRKASRVSDGL